MIRNLVLVKISLVEIRNYALPLTNTIHNIRAFIIFDCCSCCIGSRHSRAEFHTFHYYFFFVRFQKMLLFRLLLRLSRFVASAHLVNVGFWFCKCIFIFILFFALLFRELLAFSRIATFLSISFWILLQLSEILLWILFPLLICYYTHTHTNEINANEMKSTAVSSSLSTLRCKQPEVQLNRFDTHSEFMRYHTRDIPYGMPHNI